MTNLFLFQKALSVLHYINILDSLHFCSQNLLIKLFVLKKILIRINMKLNKTTQLLPY